jgi:glucose/mannose transport system permease protein
MAFSFIVTGVVWRWLMNQATDVGLVSGFKLIFQSLGLDFLVNKWHLTPTYGMAAIALAAIWQMSGYTMALYLGGLRSVSDELREAARVDGATEFQMYRHIILPMLWPVTLSAVIILGHISLKVFDLIIAVAGKQLPLDVPAIYMWQTTVNVLWAGRIVGILLISVAVLSFISPQFFTQREGS